MAEEMMIISKVFVDGDNIHLSVKQKPLVDE